MADDDDDDDDDGGGGGGVQLDVLRSYLGFGARAVRAHRALAASIFLVIFGIAITVAALYPRTYHCESQITVQTNLVLASREMIYDAVHGASGLVMRRENLESIVRQTDLARAMRQRRPFVVRLKDTVMEKVRGAPGEKDQFENAVWTLGDRLSADVNDLTVVMSVDWSDPEYSAKILQTAMDNFLAARHATEISTIAEYAAILEDHAATLRREVNTIAEQIRDLRDKARAQRLSKRTTASPAEHEAPLPALHFETPHLDGPDEELPELKVSLEDKESSIKELETLRNQDLLTQQGKLADLQTKYTSAYPAVINTQQRILELSHESPRVTELRAEAKDLETQIARRTKGAAGTGSGMGGGASYAGTPTAAPLPADIVDLVQTDDDLDPVVSAQLRYAIEKYTTLRTQISGTRIDLDTAQAAFKHRYAVTEVPEIPRKAIKPKVPLIVGIGLVLGALIAFLVPIALELRSGRIVELWQVHQLALPVLAELQFPPRPPE